MKFKDIIKITWLPVLVVSLCHLSPVVLVLFGLSTVAIASSLNDTLCGHYVWAFRVLGVIFLFISLVHYFRDKGIKTRQRVKQELNQIINLALVTIIFSVLSYIFLLYIIIEYIHKPLGI